MVRKYLLERVDDAAVVQLFAESFGAAARISREQLSTSAR